MILASLTFALVVVCLALWRLGGPNSDRRRSLLLGEELELRCVPARYLWAWGGGGAGDWDQPHWRKEPQDGEGAWEYVNTIPGAGDDVIFAASFHPPGGPPGGYGYNSDCTLRVPAAVHSITIGYGYSKTLTLLKNLTLSGSDENTRLDLKSDATITAAGAGPGDGKLILAANSGFNWATGTLRNVTVDVSTAAFTEIVPNPGGGLRSPRMSAATINVSGSLRWTAQDVEGF
jgi:hypothetical protein